LLLNSLTTVQLRVPLRKSMTNLLVRLLLSNSVTTHGPKRETGNWTHVIGMV
jgi:hypothetical protein